MTFTSLMISNLALMYTSRFSTSQGQGKPKVEKNSIFRWMLIGTGITLALILYVPRLRDLFRFSTLHPIDLILCLFVGTFSTFWLKLKPQRIPLDSTPDPD